MNKRIPANDLTAAVEAFERTGSKASAARELGIPITTLKYRLRQATMSGEHPYIQGGALPEGLTLTGVTTLFRDDKGVMQFVKTKANPSYSATYSAIEAALDKYTGYSKLPPVPKRGSMDKDTLTFYNVADPHIGMYSWKAETGHDYDTDLAKTILLETMGKLVNAAPPSEQAVVLNLGDFFHLDNERNVTERSGNTLDVDTRFARVLEVGVDVHIALIEMALQKHKTVLVRDERGNHDPYAALLLRLTMKHHFANNPRVTVDINPVPVWAHRFGNVLVGSTHGDKIKAADMPGVLAAFYPIEWGLTQHRYIYLGHVHHDSIGGGEKHGAKWETFRTLAPKDAWHKSKGYSSGRSMVAITHHKETGEFMRNTINYGE